MAHQAGEPARPENIPYMKTVQCTAPVKIVHWLFTQLKQNKIVGLFSKNGVTIENAEAVAKSYPEFWNDLEQLT